MELFRNPIVFKRPEREKNFKKIAFIGACRGAGASFVCLREAVLAKHGAALAGSGAVLAELGSPYFYEALGMKKRFSGRTFSFYEDLAKPSEISKIRNIEFGINWLLRKTASEPCSQARLIRLMSADFRSDVYFDFSGLSEDSAIELLLMADEIRLIIDPLPGRLIPSAPFIERLRLMYPFAKLVVNKMNRGVHRNELRRFLGTSVFEEIPYYPFEKICRAEYECVPPDFR